MAMIATLTSIDIEVDTPKYPCLMEHESGFIVLFTSEEEGVVVVSVDSTPEFPLGHYCDEWYSAENSAWKKLTTAVVLKNI